MTGSWKGRGNQYIQFVRVLCCAGNRTPASEVGGESVTTLPPWPRHIDHEITFCKIYVGKDILMPIDLLFGADIEEVPSGFNVDYV